MVASAGDQPNRTNVIAAARALIREGRSEQALTLLREIVCASDVPPEKFERAGATILEALSAIDDSHTQRAILFGQVTTSWLKNDVAAAALRVGIELRVTDGSFDNVLQDVTALPEAPEPHTAVLILLPWNERLLSNDARSTDARVGDELAYWRSVWDVARRRGYSRIVQVGFDWTGPGSFGHHLSSRGGSDIDTVRAVNAALRDQMPAGGYFVPLDQVSGVDGRRTFYDPRRQFWTRQPFSEAGAVSLAEHLVAGVRAITAGPKKVLVVDLDNTLWGGVVGEVGAGNIEIGGTAEGEAFLAFQRLLRTLAARGVLLAVCSKNNPDDAREPFATRAELVLGLDDFAAFEASWDSKVDAIQRIAATLALGLDTFVFFDDNPAERQHVRQALPQVLVVDVPTDPADYVRALESTLAFETVALTDEDARRTAMYAADRSRRASASPSVSVDEYLQSLDMVASLRPIDDADLPRVVQLLGKTNQFNLTTRRHSADQVRGILAREGAIGFSLRLRDRFGDHGLVAVVLALASPRDGLTGDQRTLMVDTLLMSCRVIGRTVERLLVQRLVDAARAGGFSTVRGEFIPTAKNELVRGFWESVGFHRVVDQPHADASERYDLDVAAAARLEFFIAEDGARSSVLT